jgi:hypothetical protein
MIIYIETIDLRPAALALCSLKVQQDFLAFIKATFN